LRGYVTDSSKQEVDAWSLRKITSPLGGVTELIYEADEYEQVLAETIQGGLRGPQKKYAVKSAVTDSSDVALTWFFDVESQEDDFLNTAANLPGGATKEIVIPGIWVYSADSANFYLEQGNFDNSALGLSVSYGNGTLTSSPNKISALNYYEVNVGVSTPPNGYNDPYALYWGDLLVYGGEGYIAFNYPKGHKLYGGGTRVKEMKVINDSDTYVMSYTYEQGTATGEVHDFSIGKSKIDNQDSLYQWGLTAFELNPFGLNPQVGYGKVTIENKGIDTTGTGKSIFNFFVSDEDKNYFTPHTIRKDTVWDTGEACGAGNTIDIFNKRFGIEIVDDFTSLWGKISTQNSEDVHGNLISKKVYEYTTSTKGAHVSTVNFEVEYGTADVSCAKYHAYIPTIYRKYPHYLNKITTYSNGRKSESTIEARDAFTADPTETTNTSINGTKNKEAITMAYTQTTPNYGEMGAKSDNPDHANFLGAVYASQKWVASENVTTTDFLSYGKSFWKDTTRVRYYDSGADIYTVKSDTVNWYDYTQYAWTGRLGAYGLFSYSNFTDITTPPTGTSDWRFLSEITLMDEQQNVLEQKSYNNRFAATKLGYENRFAYTSASNSNYVSFTATGFETITEVETSVFFYEGEVLAASNNQHLKIDGTVTPHTGNYMVKIPAATNNGPRYTVKYNATEDMYSLQRGRRYTASVWVHEDSPDDVQLVIDLDGSSNESFTATQNMRKDDANAIQIGEWIQLTVSTYIPEDFLTTGGTDGVKVYVKKTSAADAWVDDLQFKSNVSGSGMNVHDQKTGRVMATLGDNNFATRYVYNDAGQVIEVWQEILGDTWGKWVKMETRDYNFKRAME